jgi:Zn-dependent protease with chaperone function
VARRARRTKKKAPKTELRVRDYQYPGEKSVYWQGVIGLGVAFLAVAAIMSVYVFGKGAQHMSSPMHGKWWVPLEVLAYPILCILIVNWLAVRPRREQFKETGMQARVMSRTYPRLKQMLTEQSKLLGIAEPEMWVVEDDAPYMYAMPGKAGAIVASKPMLDALKDEEVGAMVARQMGHLKSHHVRMDLAITYIRHANPLWKILLFPVLIFAWFLRGWSELTQFTADRVGLLIAERPAVVNAALVKSAVAADRQAEIDTEELEAYLDSGDDISTDAEQIQRHFKIGQFLTTQKGLRERIEQVGEYLKTPQGATAMEKMAEMRSRL